MDPRWTFGSQRTDRLGISLTLRGRAGRALIAVVVLTSVASPTQASAAGSLIAAKESAAGYQAVADRLRTELDSGSLARAVDAVNRLGNISTIDLPRTRLTSDALTSTTSAILQAVDSIESARSTFGEAASLASQEARQVAFDALASPVGEPTPASLAARLIEARDNPATKALVTTTSSAALNIASHIDRLLPELDAAFADNFKGAATSPSCDIYDATPVLCISGAEANLHSTASALLIDLGGNDTYTSSVAAPSVLSCTTGGPECSVSVIIDVSGDDLYAPEIEGATGHNHLVAIGAAWQGVGMLIDLDGNDRYLVDVPDRDQPLRESFMIGSANIGFGLLSDFDGNDSYVVTSNSDDLLEPYAQGSSLSGAGALIDLGGNNNYKVSITGRQAAPTPDIDTSFDDYYGIAHGVALFGGAALLDRTGRASFSVEVDVSNGPSERAHVSGIIAQSVGIVGGSALLTGSGSTTYRSFARRSASATLESTGHESVPLLGIAGMSAQSVAVLGVSILDDHGGNDVYEARAISEHHLHSASSVANLSLSEMYDGSDQISGASVSAQGLSSDLFAPDAFALLNDRGGDDSYVVDAKIDAETVADPGSGSADATTSWEWFSPQVSAAGQALSAGVPAFLIDAAGDDSYSLTANARSRAKAIGDEASTAKAYAPIAGTVGQGTNFLTEPGALLMDLGGQDSYRAEAIGRATASPTPQFAYDLARIISVQGASGGVLLDVDDLVVDSFSQAPAGDTILVRGEGPAWVDSRGGVAAAPGQPAKAPSTLTFDSSNAESMTAGVLEVNAHLDSEGPVSAEEITFQIDVLAGGLLERWDTHPISSHAFTDSNGDITGLIDLDAFNSYWRDVIEWEPAELTLRITAKWAGDATHRSVEASMPFDITL